jgi:hypothetical protein
MYVGENGNTSDIVIPVAEVALSNYSQLVNLIQNYSFIKVTLTSKGNNVNFNQL